MFSKEFESLQVIIWETVYPFQCCNRFLEMKKTLLQGSLKRSLENGNSLVNILDFHNVLFSVESCVVKEVRLEEINDGEMMIMRRESV